MEEKTIKDVMNSLLNQTFLPKEIIVTEDGSTDKTSNILEEFQKRFSRYHYNNSYWK